MYNQNRVLQIIWPVEIKTFSNQAWHQIITFIFNAVLHILDPKFGFIVILLQLSYSWQQAWPTLMSNIWVSYLIFNTNFTSTAHTDKYNNPECRKAVLHILHSPHGIKPFLKSLDVCGESALSGRVVWYLRWSLQTTSLLNTLSNDWRKLNGLRCWQSLLTTLNLDLWMSLSVLSIFIMEPFCLHFLRVCFKCFLLEGWSLSSYTSNTSNSYSMLCEILSYVCKLKIYRYVTATLCVRRTFALHTVLMHVLGSANFVLRYLASRWFCYNSALGFIIL